MMEGTLPGVPSLHDAAETYLGRSPLTESSRDVYRSTLRAMCKFFGPSLPVSRLTKQNIHAFMRTRTHLAATSWNREVAVVCGIVDYCIRSGWLPGAEAVRIERRPLVPLSDRTIDNGELSRLLSSDRVPLREVVFWRMLRDTGARAVELLGLNIEDIDFPRRSAVVPGESPDTTRSATWSVETAQLLSELIKGRSSGPIFLSDRRGDSSRHTQRDVCPTTGCTRLSYRRAAEIFADTTDGWTLHQIRLTALAAAESEATVDGIQMMIAR